MLFLSSQDDDDVPDESRLADDVGGGAEAKGTGDRPVGDAQSKLVKDIMSRQVEQEAAVRGNTKVEVRVAPRLSHCFNVIFNLASSMGKSQTREVPFLSLVKFCNRDRCNCKRFCVSLLISAGGGGGEGVAGRDRSGRQWHPPRQTAQDRYA